MPDLKRIYPDFEKPIVSIQEKIEKIEKKDPSSEELNLLRKKREQLIEDVFSDISPWQRVQVARHPMRPHPLDYFESMLDDFVELRGDRSFGDDRAVVGGIASLEGETVIVIGTQKGRSMDENIERNFGMPHPEGYRKALRLMKLAEKFSFPVITFVDTPGAFPGIGAEERGQAEAIARNLRDMMEIKTPITVVVIGEGGSGGALGLGVGDRILMLENSVYFVCTPEACSAILWRDATKAETAAKTMRITAADLKSYNIIDEIVKEPKGGAHWNPEKMFSILKKRLKHHLGVLKRTKDTNLFKKRFDKFRKIGEFTNEKHPKS
ncbi:MAG: acetyl-CoA carboxylase carboxyltransferase subunit alpha [Elusimicrobiota bacterium]